MNNFYSPSGAVVVSNNPYISQFTPTRAPEAHEFRFNSNTQTLEVWAGSYWQQLDLTRSIDLSPEVLKVLDWAREQMNKQKQLKELAATYPSVAHALDAVEQAQRELEVVAELVK